MSGMSESGLSRSEIKLSDVHVWKVPLSEPGGSSKCLEKILSSDERTRANRFIQARDRERYIVAHGALRQILAEYLAGTAASVRFTASEFGKPQVQGVEFNLSHSGDLALVAVRRKCKIGVDVEEVRTGLEDSGVAERFFSAGELRRLRPLHGEEWTAGFFRCWTRKEAYLKAIGCGISDEDLAAAEVTLLAEEKPLVVRRGPRDDVDGEWSVTHLEPGAGYVGAIVAEGSGLQFHFRRWPEDLTRD